uniref:collectin-12-like isoform X2 n=1 Tax=Styela clava TaxID=7725 RepID=UPI00193982D6|nr:collectin-12-like isoform X2 [Styela clava]
MSLAERIGIAVFAVFLFGKCGAFIETTMSNEYMICRPVAGVFGTLGDGKNSSEKGIMPVLQGPEGSPGPPGKTGLPGPRGEPNYQKVSTIVGDKMHSINARLFKLESELASLKASGGGGGGGGGGSSGGYVPPTQSPEDIKNAKDCMDKYKSPINIGTMCYNIIGGEGLLWTFTAAESNCSKLGGYLADLNSREVYDKIYNYIDQTYSTVVQAWTGMRYENNNLIKTDGKQAKFSKWMTYNPRKSGTSFYRSYTYILARIDTSSRVNRKLSYAICHFDISGAVTTRRIITETTRKTRRPYTRISYGPVRPLNIGDDYY